MPPKTPKKEKIAENLETESRKPSVELSPHVPKVKVHKQGNLTGSARKIKDSAADFHNLISKWDKFNKQGLSIVNEIANIKIEQVFSEDKEDKDWNPLPEALEALCEGLEKIYTSMVKVVRKLEYIVKAISGVDELEQHNRSIDSSNQMVFFQTWTTSHFVSTMETLYEMYAKEIGLKKQIVENVAHSPDRSTSMFYSALWLHQPYIDSSADMLLESMLLETMLK